jgi:type II secretory ATPase GspE/PulE/Tfp pilus assembly ATPase PilB-like protein
MVGEIRDKETAEIAMKASQTGHMVLSTLHTNDSVAAITRLIDLGAPGYLVAASVSGVMAQRLVRRLCTCKKTVPATREFLDQLEELGAPEMPATQATPVGCEICDHTGYKGRIGIYETLVIDMQIRAAIREEARSDEIRAIARSHGLKLMQEQAIEFVCRGVTMLEEVKRVVPFEKLSFLSCAACHRKLLPSFAFCPYCGTTRAPSGKPTAAYAAVGASVA